MCERVRTTESGEPWAEQVLKFQDSVASSTDRRISPGRFRKLFDLLGVGKIGEDHRNAVRNIGIFSGVACVKHTHQQGVMSAARRRSLEDLSDPYLFGITPEAA